MYTVLVTAERTRLNVHDLLHVVEVERGVIFGDEAVDIVRLERLAVRRGTDVLGAGRGVVLHSGGAVDSVGEGPAQVGAELVGA